MTKKQLDYQKYLQSDHWIKLKKKIYSSRRGRECKICSSQIKLNIHHKSYKTKDGVSVLGKETLGRLVVLCQDCHFLWHNTVNQKHKLRTKHISRIKNLMELGLSKKTAFNNCYEDKYKKTKLLYSDYKNIVVASTAVQHDQPHKSRL